jgi:ubiquinone/menaquinone biosynthesis C-methylase UbiE
VKRNYFNELAVRWDSLPSLPGAQESVAEFCRRTCPRNGGRLLDVGCGTGLLAPHLLNSDWIGSIVELDFALEMLRESKRKLKDVRLRHVCADARVLPFCGVDFDAVLCFGVLPHLGSAATALEELWRVVRPGGCLAIGHLMGSQELNAFHGSLGEPVSGDMLLPSDSLAEILRSLGAAAVIAEETPEWYFVRAEKRRA